jgi:membrane associated rhomboid family serine protease
VILILTNDFLLVITLLITLIGFGSERFFMAFQFSPYKMQQNNQWYRFITHAFLHKDIFHLFLNAFVLLLLGREVESFLVARFHGWGNVLYLIIYLSSIAISSLGSFLRYKDDETFGAVGASGAVSAVIFAYIVLFPEKTVTLFLLHELDLPSLFIGLIYLVYSWFMAKNSKSSVGHDVHLVGALFGLVIFLILFPGQLLSLTKSFMFWL